MGDSEQDCGANAIRSGMAAGQVASISLAPALVEFEVANASVVGLTPRMLDLRQQGSESRTLKGPDPSEPTGHRHHQTPGFSFDRAESGAVRAISRTRAYSIVRETRGLKRLGRG